MEISIDSTKNTAINISEDTFMYLQKPIDTFDIENLKLITSLNEDNFYQIFYSYSYDQINFADFKFLKDFINPDNINIPIYIGIHFKKIESTDLQKVLTFNQQKNVNSNLHEIKIDSLTYDSIIYDLKSEIDIKFETLYKVINQYPRWNFYDNQQVTINRWLQQINAISEMYGHTCIYFKTEPIESKIEHTFKNNVFRNVTNIKKLHILSPNNELPQDRVIYSDWDMPLQDDFVIHIVKNKFEQAFGEFKIPIEKDYLYLPIINKLFRVASSQPKSGLMGKVGWWEVYLAKFEEDECVTINDDLKTAMEGYSDFDLAIDSIDTFDDTIKSEIFNELNEFESNTLLTVEKLDEKNIDEKKEVTQNFTNKLIDSNHYISLKETEKIRDSYDNRLKIISVNPDSSNFPITMYDNSTVDKRTVAMQYFLKDYTTKNKISIKVSKNFELSFNYVYLNNFVGEIFDLLNSTGNLSIFTLKSNRNKLELIDNRVNKTILIDYTLIQKELYNIVLNYDLNLKQFSIKIFRLNNNEKLIDYQNIYIINEANNMEFEICYIHLFGGNFYSNDIRLNINDKNIMKDYVNPLLIMKEF